MDNKLALFLQELLGISLTSAQQMTVSLQQSGELDTALSTLEELESELDDDGGDETDMEFNVAGDDEIDSPTDPDNTDYKQYYDKHKTTGWDPTTDKELADIAIINKPNVADPNEYEGGEDDQQMENVKPRFLAFLSEQMSNNDVDSTLIDAGNDIEDDFDEPTARRIKLMLKQGNETGANKLRQQALRRRNASQPKGPLTPAQQMVKRRKEQLAQAMNVANRERERTNG